MLLQTAQVSGLTSGLSRQLRPWRAPRSVHDPGKTVLASDPTISRLIDALGGEPAAAIAAIRRARAAARAAVWQLSSPVPAAGEVVIDLDATLFGAHSEKENATPNFKRGFGFHPMMAFVDHGAGGTGEPLAAMLRPGRANASDAADQIAVLDAALTQLPEALRSRVLVRGDTGSGVKEFLWHIRHLSLSYSVGVYGRQPVLDALAALPRQAWRQAREADGRPRDGAQVAELTRWLPATVLGWPPGMRVIARRERPHPGAQLRITDTHG